MCEDPAVADQLVQARDRVRAAVVALLLVHAALRAWLVLGAWFYSDDFLLLERVARPGTDLASLFTPHDSQVMPIGIALTWAVSAAGPYAWTTAALLSWVLQVVAAVSFWWMLRTLFGERAGILVPLGLFCLSTMGMDTSVWWAASLNALPMQIAFCWLVTCLVQWSRAADRAARLRCAAGTLAAWVAALGAGPRGFVLAVPVAVLVVVFLTPRGRWRTHAVRVARSFGLLVLPLAAIGVGWLAYYLTHAPSPVQRASTPAGRLAVDLLTASWAPSLVGGPWRWDVVADPVSVPHAPVALRVLAVLAVTGWATWVVRRRPRAALGALAMVLAHLTVTYLALAFGRGTQLGALAALNTRYLADALPVAALAVGLAHLPLAGHAGPDPDRSTAPSGWGRHAMVVAIAVTTVGAVASTVLYAKPWHRPFPAERWVANAHASLLEDPGPVADQEVPPLVQLPLHYPANLPSHLLAPYGDLVDARTEGNDLRVFDEDGVARPAVVEGTTSVRGPLAGCGHRVEQRTVTIALDRDAMVPLPWTAIGYAGSGPARATVSFDGRPGRSVEVLPGAHTLFLRGDGRYSQAEIVVTTPGAALCVDRVVAGTLKGLP